PSDFFSPIFRRPMPKLHPHIGVPVPRHRVLPALATIAILLVAVGVNMAGFNQSPPVIAPQKISQGSALPSVLSENDAARYRQAFTLQGQGQVEQADEAVAGIGNPLLRGVLLGERYLMPGREPNFSELALWLASYGDHAQAATLYKLAQTR